MHIIYCDAFVGEGLKVCLIYDRKTKRSYKFSYLEFILRRKFRIYQLANILQFCFVNITTIFLMSLFIKKHKETITVVEKESFEQCLYGDNAMDL